MASAVRSQLIIDVGGGSGSTALLWAGLMHLWEPHGSFGGQVHRYHTVPPAAPASNRRLPKLCFHSNCLPTNQDNRVWAHASLPIPTYIDLYGARTHAHQCTRTHMQVFYVGEIEPTPSKPDVSAHPLWRARVKAWGGGADALAAPALVDAVTSRAHGTRPARHAAAVRRGALEPVRPECLAPLRRCALRVRFSSARHNISTPCARCAQAVSAPA